MKTTMLAALAMLAVGGFARAGEVGCPAGHFEAVGDGAGRLRAGTHLVLDDDGNFSFGFICAPVSPRANVLDGETFVDAEWETCGDGLFGPMSMWARIDPSCTWMTGWVRSDGVTKRFEAFRIDS